MRNATPLLLLASCFAVLAAAPAQQSAQQPVEQPVERYLDEHADHLEALYRHLHQHPELSFREVKTAARMAEELRALGIEVTEQVGGTGVVGVLRCGDGPVALLRADMDALPVAEETGLPYASKIRAESADGRAVGVMHACGHDLHMTCLIGAAGYFARHRDAYPGTIVFMLQPAEERSGGMDRMLADGLLTRFPRADFALALHTAHDLPVGVVGLRAGPAMANVDSCDITLYGKAGHGAAPHLTIDPIVQASKLVLDLQTIVSREVDPVDACVITVGSIHGGQKHNIIPSSCHLQLTIRSYTDEVRAQMLAAIRRKAAAAAASCGAKEPKIEFSESTPALQNHEQLTAKVREGIAAALGQQNVVEIAPAMVAEDFGRLRGAGVPLCMFRLGTVAPARLARLREQGAVPGLHSGGYYPDYASALRVGVRALVAATRRAAERN
ncbi:MAG: amidohydrolase [Planctomycetes bacterium]|nr:amidohydrolase [Planctomycetota bacterium]